MSFLEDEAFWLLISFLVFSGILLKYGKGKILSILDKRIQTIRDQIKTAETLRTEAQELLAQYQRKQRDSEKEAERFLTQAEKQADEMRKKAETDLDESIARREALLQERLTRMTLDAKEEIRQYAARLALEATQKIILEKLDKTANENLITRSIQELEHTLRS